MSHSDPGPLATYNSLADKHLAGYFNNTKSRRHLRKSGLINRSGEIISEETFRLNMARKEHKKHVKNLLAQAIVHKALDMERNRQVEIRRKLEEIAKIELVRRVRAERARKGDEDILPYLSPRTRPHSGPTRESRFRRDYGRPVSAPTKREEEDEHDDEEDNYKEDTHMEPIYITQEGYPVQPHSQELDVPVIDARRTAYPKGEIDSRHLWALDRVALLQYTLNNDTLDKGRGAPSPYVLPLLPTPPTGSKNSTPRSTSSGSSTGRTPRSKRRTKLSPTGPSDTHVSPPRPKTNKGSLMLHRVEPAMKHQARLQSMCDVTMKYLGSHIHLERDGVDPYHDILVDQQHCGGNTLAVFKERLLPKSTFTFTSRRHRGYPFSLSIYVNGIMDVRLSACCEYKHFSQKGKILGGKTGHFQFIDIEGAAPCYRCQVEKGLDLNTRPPVPESKHVKKANEEAEKRKKKKKEKGERREQRKKEEEEKAKGQQEEKREPAFITEPESPKTNKENDYEDDLDQEDESEKKSAAEDNYDDDDDFEEDYSEKKDNPTSGVATDDEQVKGYSSDDFEDHEDEKSITVPVQTSDNDTDRSEKHKKKSSRTDRKEKDIAEVSTEHETDNGRHSDDNHEAIKSPRSVVSDKSAKSDKSSKSNKSDRSTKSDRSKTSGRSTKSGKSTKSNKSDKPKSVLSEKAETIKSEEDEKSEVESSKAETIKSDEENVKRRPVTSTTESETEDDKVGDSEIDSEKADNKERSETPVREIESVSERNKNNKKSVDSEVESVKEDSIVEERQAKLEGENKDLVKKNQQESTNSEIESDKGRKSRDERSDDNGDDTKEESSKEENSTPEEESDDKDNQDKATDEDSKTDNNTKIDDGIKDTKPEIKIDKVDDKVQSEDENDSEAVKRELRKIVESDTGDTSAYDETVSDYTESEEENEEDEKETDKKTKQKADESTTDNEGETTPGETTADEADGGRDPEKVSKGENLNATLDQTMETKIPKERDGAIRPLVEGNKDPKVADIELDKEQIKELADLIKEKGDIESLTLTNDKLQDDDLADIAEAIRTSPSDIKMLNLNMNKISVDGASHVVSVINAKPDIKMLLLQGNPLGDGGVTVIVNGLVNMLPPEKIQEYKSKQINTVAKSMAKDIINEAMRSDSLQSLVSHGSRDDVTSQSESHDSDVTSVASVPASEGKGFKLSQLDLGDCSIGDGGAKQVAKLIAMNTTIQSLNLSGNSDITLEGWKAISDAMRANKVIKTLTLDHNKLGDDVIKVIANGLKRNKCLECVDFVGNDIGDKGAQELLSMVRFNSRIKDITLMPGNNMSPKFFDDIKNAMALNKM